MALGTNDAVDFAKIPPQDMPEEEKKGVECLVWRRGRDPMLDGQRGKEAANLLVAEFGGGSAADESLKTSDPKAIGFEGAGGIVAELDGAFQVVEFPLPGSSIGSGAAYGWRSAWRRGARRS